MAVKFRCELAARHQGPAFPFIFLLKEFIQQDFNTTACREIFLKYLNTFSESELEKFVHLDGFSDGGYLFTKDCYFPKIKDWFLSWRIQAKERQQLSFYFKSNQFEAPSQLLRLLTHQQNLEKLRLKIPDVDKYLPSQLQHFVTPEKRYWKTQKKSGIFRREHASLLICSESTSILIDPIDHHSRLPCIDQVPLPSKKEKVDAILVTHSHGDHWHLPSILSRVGENRSIPIVVPQVSQKNILCPTDFKTELQLSKQKFIQPAWNTTVVIGDIEIDILPFYGEQPTVDQKGVFKSVRNWGNCFRINTPEFSAIVLADSGQDPDGSMLEEIEKSVDKRGPADIVLSCGRNFQSPFYAGLGQYWSSLPWEQLQRLYKRKNEAGLPSVMATGEYLARICDAAKCIYFLPYANGFNGINKPISDIGWGTGEPSEHEVFKSLVHHLKSKQISTEVLDWVPGDFARISRKASNGKLKLTL